MSDYLKNMSPAVRERNKQILEPNIPAAIKRNRKTDENDLQSEIIAHLQTLGYLVVHFRPAKTEHGWVTPVEGDGTGWPDVVAVGHARVIVIEVKSSSGKVSEAQYEWLREWIRVPGATVAIVRPESWEDFKRHLGG